MPVETPVTDSYREDLVSSGVVIKTEALAKVYEMGAEQVHALRGVDVEIRKGEYVAIMGPSGSGKSTLMNLIGCLDTPSKGQYYLNGKLASDMSDDELAQVDGKNAGGIAKMLVAKGSMSVWQYAVHKSASGDLEQAPLHKVGLIATESLRVEPYASPLRVLPVDETKK